MAPATLKPPSQASRLRLRVYAIAAIVVALGLAVVLSVAGYHRAQTVSVLEDGRRRCGKGDAAACQRLGWEYEQGGRVTPDLAQALFYYRRSCEGGNALGCFFGGTLLEGKRDLQGALEGYERSCRLGHKDACGSAKRLRKRLR